jgi:hypothetical protein
MTPRRVDTPDTASQHARPPTILEPSNKLQRIMTHVTNELGTLMSEDVKRLETVDIFSLFKLRQGRGDFTNLDRICHHPAHQYLKHISVHGAPVVLTHLDHQTPQGRCQLGDVGRKCWAGLTPQGGCQLGDFARKFLAGL